MCLEERMLVEGKKSWILDWIDPLWRKWPSGALSGSLRVNLEKFNSHFVFQLLWCPEERRKGDIDGTEQQAKSKPLFWGTKRNDRAHLMPSPTIHCLIGLPLFWPSCQRPSCFSLFFFWRQLFLEPASIHLRVDRKSCLLTGLLRLIMGKELVKQDGFSFWPVAPR